jgi:hypothetical protein
MFNQSKIMLTGYPQVLELRGSVLARVSTNMPLLTELKPKANVSAASTALAIATFFLNRSRRPQKTPGEGTRPTCFAGWKSDKVFYYVLVNLLNGNVFVAPDRFGKIGLVAIAWVDDAVRIMDLNARALPLFDWNEFPKSGDSIVVADVAGDRKLMPEILEQAMGRWVDAPQKRLFTYRRGKLAELSWKKILRFSGNSPESGVHSPQSEVVSRTLAMTLD